MKTQSKKINLKAAALFLLIAGNTKLHSQTFWTVRNALSPCAMTVDILVYDTNSCSTPCNTITGQVIGANSTFTIPLGSCATTLCNISVSITDINGPYSQGPVDFSTNLVTFSGPCSTTNLEYIAGGMVFKVY
jgi:hypothetical protein